MNPERMTVAQLVLGQLDILHLEAQSSVRAARELHAIEQSAYTTGRLKYDEALLAVIKTLKARIPPSWRKFYVEGP